LLQKQKNLELPRSLENFARGLLATTCLTMAGSTVARASTVTLLFGTQETPLGPSFGPSVTTVDGFVGELPSEGGFSPRDWFEFTGLTPGSSYTLTGSYDPLGRFAESGNGESGLRMSVFTDTLTPLFVNQSLETASRGGTGAQVMGTIPGDGNLEVEIYVSGGPPAASVIRSLQVEGIGEGGERGGSSYQVQLTQNAEVGSTVPEPASLTTAGLALAGALAWRRKRAQ
jgi:hypothetical protein